MMMNTQKDDLTDNINIKLTTLNLITPQDERYRSAFSCPISHVNCPSTEHLPLEPLIALYHHFCFLSMISHTSQDGGSTPTNNVKITTCMYMPVTVCLTSRSL